MFASNGGTTPCKAPDLTAADGVLKTLSRFSGLNPLWQSHVQHRMQAQLRHCQAIGKSFANTSADKKSILTSTALMG